MLYHKLLTFFSSADTLPCVRFEIRDVDTCLYTTENTGKGAQPDVVYIHLSGQSLPMNTTAVCDIVDTSNLLLSSRVKITGCGG